MKKVEAMLLTVNPQDRITTEHQSATVTCLDDSNLISDPHPLFSRLNLGDCLGAVGDLKESINISQSDQQCADMEATGKGPSVPFVLARAVEQLLATRAHRTWCLQNANLLAPISIPMWKFWGNPCSCSLKDWVYTCMDRADSLHLSPLISGSSISLLRSE